MNKFIKSHGLGNSYLIFDQKSIDFSMSPAIIKKLCNQDFGIGSDGILLKVPSENADFGVRIFNPDGSEAEKSGNGLRIIGKYLFDYGFSTKKAFNIESLGGIVEIEILKEKQGCAKILKAGMGKAFFEAQNIPVKTEAAVVLNHLLKIADEELLINCVSLGNPHCVIFEKELDEKRVRKLGPLLEKHHVFPSKTNVQFAKIIDSQNVEILIWERSAGFTQASGTSSCAVAAVGHKLNLLDNKVTLHMPGGQLNVEIKDNWNLFLTGEVEQTCEGNLTKGFFN